MPPPTAEAGAAAPAIIWFRQDLRLADNPALTAAAESGRPVLALYVLDDTAPAGAAPGGAARWWLHHSLAALDQALGAHGAGLLLRRGDPARVLPALAAESGAAAVYWNRCYEPHGIARDTALKTRLQGDGIAVESHNAGLLFEPWTIRTGAGGWFKVFTPFWRTCLTATGPPAPIPAPSCLQPVAAPPAGEALGSWCLRPTRPDWAAGFDPLWTPGEAGARERLARFLDDGIADYAAARDRPGEAGTSRLSPHLHWGEIGPRQVWHGARQRLAAAGVDEATAKFLSELGWREFSHHLLYHVPELPTANSRDSFDAFPWADDPAGLAAWQRGRTGYPMVDAGMRELWATGWMHNRVRMIAASFLVKHLLIDWRQGADWFMDTLVDADLANNAAGWQWVAGSGADAAPYFRIFNPVLQGQKFDPDGAYVRRWLPELARLPDRFLHCPWEAPEATLAAAGIALGRDYPRPVVDHRMARQRALDAFARIRGS